MNPEINSTVQQTLCAFGGSIKLGHASSYNWITDPARVLFSLSRYKFVSQMLSGFNEVLEVGCADGLGVNIVAQKVKHVTCIDIDPSIIDSAREIYHPKNVSFIAGDVTSPDLLYGCDYDGIYLLDVLEHVSVSDENSFISSLCLKLKPFGTMIIGMPSLESQEYASSLSRIGHVNCKTQVDLLELCKHHFHVCYMLGANDEVIHTGFSHLQHYRLALCSVPRIYHCKGNLDG